MQFPYFQKPNTLFSQKNKILGILENEVEDLKYYIRISLGQNANYQYLQFNLCLILLLRPYRQKIKCNKLEFFSKGTQLLNKIIFGQFCHSAMKIFVSPLFAGFRFEANRKYLPLGLNTGNPSKPLK